MPNPCLRCRSDKIIPDVPMWDHIGDFGIRASQLRVEVAGKPSALVFTDKAVGDVCLNICGDCGHADVVVKNARVLWDKHVQSKQD